MQALILAAGLGTRIRPLFVGVPKAMVDVNGRPFLVYLLEHLKANGVKEVVLAVGFLANKIRHYFGDGKSFGMKIIYSEGHLPLGTAGEIKLAEPHLANRFFVINGDTYLPINYKKVLEFHKRNCARVTIVLSRAKREMLGGRVGVGTDGLIESFEEEGAGSRRGWINAGLYVFEKNFVDLIPKGKRTSLEHECFPKCIEDNLLYGYKTDRNFMDVGTPEAYHKLARFLRGARRES